MKKCVAGVVERELVSNVTIKEVISILFGAFCVSSVCLLGGLM